MCRTPIDALYERLPFCVLLTGVQGLTGCHQSSVGESMTTRKYYVPRRLTQSWMLMFLAAQVVTATLTEPQGRAMVKQSSSPTVGSTWPYSIEFEVRSQWLDPSGKLLEDVNVVVNVSVGSETVFIAPRRGLNNTNSAFLSWSPSPVNAGEWINYLELSLSSNQIDTIIIDTHPTIQAKDLFTSLGRILYVSDAHPVMSSMSEVERLYIPGECSLYTPDEIDFQMRTGRVGLRDMPQDITAYTPDYYVDTRRRKKKFAGPPFKRKLWVITIEQYTNWHDLLIPSTFTYRRYQDPDLRANAENEAAIAKCDGRLVSISEGANRSLTSRLERRLKIIDFRPRDELFGYPARYEAGWGEWPRLGTDEYHRIVATNKVQIASLLANQPANSGLSRGSILFIAIFGLLLLPVAYLLHGRRKGQYSKPNQEQD